MRKEEQQMDQKSLMLDAAEKLTALSETLKALADSVQAEEAKGTDSQPEKAKAPEKKSTGITLEKVRGILADKSRAGHTAEVRAIIQKHGASRLSEVNPEQYAAIIQEAEVL